MRVILSILLSMVVSLTFGQTFVYSYNDPCTGVLKSINVPTNGVTITYYGQINTFNQSDFQNGNFNNWSNNIYNTYGSNNPCGSIIGISTGIDIGLNSAINTISILNSLSALSDLQSSMGAGGVGSLNTMSAVESAKSSSKKKDKSNSNESKSESNGSNSNGSSSNNTTGSNTSGSNGSSSNGSSDGSSNVTLNSGGETNTSNSSVPTNGVTVGSNSQNESNNNSSSSTNTSESNSSSTSNQNTSVTTNGTTTNGSSTSSDSGGSSTNGSTTSSGSGGSTTTSSGSNGTTTNDSSNDNSAGNGSNSTNSETNSNSGSNTGSDGTSSKSTDSNSENATPSQSSDTPKSTEAKGSTNILGGSVVSIQKSTEKNGGKPSVILSSDFTGFNFKQNDVTYGGKGTGGFTSMRWDGRRTHGFLVDYTTAMKGPNFTTFYAFIHKKRIDLISGTLTTSFLGKGSIYGTIALGQMWTIKKNLKVIYMATSSFGQVYQEKFLGTAFIAGGMYDWKASKRIDVKFMNLFIYAPYVSYYNDLVLKSPYVIMPIIGTNIGITKKFKLNINFGSTYAINQNIMNFTLMFGTRLAI